MRRGLLSAIFFRAFCGAFDRPSSKLRFFTAGCEVVVTGMNSFEVVRLWIWISAFDPAGPMRIGD